jgi:hypothetical protein
MANQTGRAYAAATMGLTLTPNDVDLLLDRAVALGTLGRYQDSLGDLERVAALDPDRAEAWGIDCVWLGEIHFTPTRSIISASLQVASAIAARTRRVRVGTAVQVLPLNHPLRIAEEVAGQLQRPASNTNISFGRPGNAKKRKTTASPKSEEALSLLARR